MYLHSNGKSGDIDDAQMISSASTTVLSVDPYLDIDDLLCWLRDDVNWPDGLVPRRATLRRFWAGRRERISFEITLTLAQAAIQRTCVLQGIRAKFPKGGRRSHAPYFHHDGCRSLCVVNDKLGVWMCSADCDPFLPAVRDLLDADRLPAALHGTDAADWLQLSRPGAELSARVAAHRVAKRGVVCIESRHGDPSRGVFAKVFRRPVQAEQIESYRAVAAHLCHSSEGAFQSPRILDSYTVGSSGVMIAERVEAPAAQLGESQEDIRLAARLLAALHAIDVPLKKAHSTQNEVETVERWLAGLRITGRAESARFRQLSEAILKRAATLPLARSTIVHRDYHRAQVLRGQDTVWLLDLDTLSRGDQEVDLSTFAAHLVLDSTIAGGQHCDVTRLLALFLEAYVAEGGVFDDQRLSFYLLCALSRLGALHLLRGQPPLVIEALWTMAEDVVLGVKPWC